MRKKRKVWWIVGGVLCFFALIFVTALLVERNSEEARLERALQVIIVEQGLEYKETRVRRDRDSGEVISWTLYEGEPISLAQKKRVLDQLREFFPSYSIEVLTRDQGNFDAIPSSGPTFDIIVCRTKEESTIVTFSMIFDDRGFMSENDSPSSSLGVSRLRDDPLLFLKRLWPW